MIILGIDPGYHRGKVGSDDADHQRGGEALDGDDALLYLKQTVPSSCPR